MVFLTSILQGAPVWVWPLLALLVFVGVKATRTRSVVVWPFYLLPLLGILALNAVNGLLPSMVTWAVFGAAYIVGAFCGFRVQKRIVLEKSASKVTLRGEWITLAILMAIFWLNFLAGTIEAVAPAFFATAMFHNMFAVVAGLISGAFLGRAIRTYSTAKIPA